MNKKKVVTIVVLVLLALILGVVLFVGSTFLSGGDSGGFSTSLDQYRPPHNYELSGRTISFRSTDGEEAEFQILDDNTVSTTFREFSQEDGYECLKVDDHVYLLHYELAGQDPRRCVTLAVDMGSGQAILLFAKQGDNEEDPKKVSREVLIGSVADENGTYPAITAGYTEDLVGSKIKFTYTDMITVRQSYLEPHRYQWAFYINGIRIPFLQGEEYCDMVRLNDHIVLFSWLEADSGVQGMYLVNLDHCYHVGSFFGIGTDGEPECYTMGAYGKEV